MATIVTRSGKGSALTHTEMDANFNNLNDDKVETSAIGTAAASDVTTSSTDTTAGRLLKVGDFGVGNPLSVYAIDFNSLTQTGVYALNGHADWNNSTNRPTSITNQQAHITVINKNNDSAEISQEVVLLDANRKFFRCSYFNGGWSSWQEIYHQGSILGTVSQSGGVPTGAIIERGSNANGEYVKYADGTMICQHILSFTTNQSSYLGRVSSAVQWDYPTAFYSYSEGAQTVFGTSSNTNSRFFVIAAGASTQSYNRLIMFKTDSSTDTTRDMRLTAIGRWY